MVQDAVRDFELVAPAGLPTLYRRLLEDLARKRLPERRLRRCPRVVNCKILPWPLKREEHGHPPQPNRPYEQSLQLV